VVLPVYAVVVFKSKYEKYYYYYYYYYYLLLLPLHPMIIISLDCTVKLT